MKVTMMGAGAMGGMVGARLAAAGNDVWLVDTWPEHVAKMQKEGLVLDTKEGTKVLKVNATTRVQDVYDQNGYAELVIIFVNANFTDQITRDALAIIGPDTYVLTMQNGVGNADIIARYVPKNRIICGTTLCAGVVEGPGHVRDSSQDYYTAIMPMEGPVTDKITERRGTSVRSFRGSRDGNLAQDVRKLLHLRHWYDYEAQLRTGLRRAGRCRTGQRGHQGSLRGSQCQGTWSGL